MLVDGADFTVCVASIVLIFFQFISQFLSIACSEMQSLRFEVIFYGPGPILLGWECPICAKKIEVSSVWEHDSSVPLQHLSSWSLRSSWLLLHGCCHACDEPSIRVSSTGTVGAAYRALHSTSILAFVNPWARSKCILEFEDHSFVGPQYLKWE